MRRRRERDCAVAYARDGFRAEEVGDNVLLEALADDVERGRL